MSRSRRLAPVALMGSLAVAYVLARDRIAVHVEHLAIFEFPIGALVFGTLLWAALSRRQATTPTLTPWRRHKQVVRALPDPAIALDVLVLERWVQEGEAPEAAASVAARAASTDEGERATLSARFHDEMSNLASRRKRESYLKEKMQQGA